MTQVHSTLFKRTVCAATIAAALGLSSVASAANTDGSIVGSVESTANRALAGAAITIRNKETGFTRTINADENGNYRFAHLPAGIYSINAKKVGFETTQLDDVTVSLGSATNVGLTLAAGNIEVISVNGSAMSQIDVTSSESALNITAIELSRLPIARDVNAVALLAPGTTEGDSRFDGSISFGGASPAENTTYINGLNVTNFRNGIGFSTVPYSFYKEFQQENTQNISIENRPNNIYQLN